MREKPSVERVPLATLTAVLSAGALILVSGLFSGSISSISETAQLAQAATGESGNVSLTAPTSCEKAKQLAFTTRKDNDGPAVSYVTGLKAGATTLDACWGAVITELGKMKRQNPARYGSLTVNDYECTGRVGTARVATNKVSDITTAQRGVPPGKCQLTVKDEVLNPAGKGEQPPSGNQGKGGMPQLPQIPMPPKMPSMPPSPQSEASAQQDPCTADTVSGTLNEALGASNPCPSAATPQVPAQTQNESGLLGNLWDSVLGNNESTVTNNPTPNAPALNNVGNNIARLGATPDSNSGGNQNSVSQQPVVSDRTGFGSPNSGGPPATPVSSLPQYLVEGIQNFLSGATSWLRNTFNLR